ncbi:hypothetical protein MtrunA17_Chr2g0293051 [Medicago truncatula]|uniref:Transmembrane protein n=1 Tax=Medicago truncatula TaxID=3880 RepID=A0A396J4R3_MEDTR|nr:hypothetical protein MtrunA17_Chr2g0293051 [Medicago truncatula]
MFPSLEHHYYSLLFALISNSCIYICSNTFFCFFLPATNHNMSLKFRSQHLHQRWKQRSKIEGKIVLQVRPSYKLGHG